MINILITNHNVKHTIIIKLIVLYLVSLLVHQVASVKLKSNSSLNFTKLSGMNFCFQLTSGLTHLLL